MKLQLKQASTLPYAFVVLLTLVSIRLWSFQGITERVYNVLEMAVLAITVVIFVLKFRAIKKNVTMFSTNVYLLTFLPGVSAFGALIFHQQQLSQSLYSVRRSLFWLLYFVLHILNIPTRSLVKLMVVIGAVWAFLTIAQQFTYPTYFFYTRIGEDGDSEFYRAGVYRFMLYRHHYGMFIILFFYVKYFQTRAVKYLIPVLFGLAAFYYFGTRQFAISVFVCMIIASLAQKGMARVYSVIVLAVLTGALLIFKDSLFGAFIEMTKDQLGTEDIRMLSAKFFLFDYWPHWLAVIIGNGEINPNSAYGMEVIAIQESTGFHRTDIGILGTLSIFGAIYVINLLWMNIKALSSRFYTNNNSYLRLFFLNTLMLIYISDYSAQHSAIPFFCFILYFVDKVYLSKRTEKARQRTRNKLTVVKSIASGNGEQAIGRNKLSNQY